MRVKKWFVVIVMFLSIFLVSCSTRQENSNLVTINSVYDGDTFYSKNYSFRLFGVDTAELKNEGKYTQGHEFVLANEAKNFTESLILNKKVKFTKITNDKYKRTVAKVFVDGVDLAKELLKNGLAIISYFSLDKKSQYYNSDENYYKELLNSQKYAKIRKIGYWKYSEKTRRKIYPKHFK